MTGGSAVRNLPDCQRATAAATLWSRVRLRRCRRCGQLATGTGRSPGAGPFQEDHVSVRTPSDIVELSSRAGELGSHEGDGVPSLRLTAAERRTMRDIAEFLPAQDPEQPDDEYLEAVAFLAQELPSRLRRELLAFQLTG